MPSTGHESRLFWANGYADSIYPGPQITSLGGPGPPAFDPQSGAIHLGAAGPLPVDRTCGARKSSERVDQEIAGRGRLGALC
jgi:hypothetical protein